MKYIKKFNESLKNAVQIVDRHDIKNSQLREDLDLFYEEQQVGSDCYHRYYPFNWEYPNEFKEGLTERFNEWLIENGYELKSEPHFYLLYRFNW